MRPGIFLGLLCLSGCQTSSSLLRQYHYVADPMTWSEAQTYCRERYTDLATVENPEEEASFRSTVPPLKYGSFVWTGLYSKINWKWSDGYNGTGADFRLWQSVIADEPDFYAGKQFCAFLSRTDRWWDGVCSNRFNFVCYKGTQQHPAFVYVNEALDWSSAQRYCRENFKDLATIKNEGENKMIHNILPDTDNSWIGLYRDPNIYWSDGSAYTFKHWYGKANPLGNMNEVCAVADMQISGKWRVQSCEARFPFVCYSPATRKQVIKLRIELKDPSVDPNNPAVKEDILKKLQDRMKETGSH